MTKIIALSSHKGGVGKTTSTINIGAGISNGKKGKRVLLIDLDPQANLTHGLGIKKSEKTIYGSLKGSYPLSVITLTDKLHVIPSTLDLAYAEVELSAEVGREFILKNLLESLNEVYDFIFIDCPPSIGFLTVNALTASDEVYIPLQTEYYALHGLTRLLEIKEKVKKNLNNKLELGGIIFTQYSSRRTLNNYIVSKVEEKFQEKVFKTKIRDTISLAEAPTKGLDIFQYSPKSTGAKDYKELCEEILKRI